MGDILRKGVEHIPMVPLGVSKLEYLFINFSSLMLMVSLEILTGISSLLNILLKTENALR